MPIRFTDSLAVAALLIVAGCSRPVQTAPSTPVPARTTPRATPAPLPTAAAAPAAVAEEILTRTNTERRNAKLPPLTRSVNLMRAAEIQASEMARLNKLEHVLPGATYPTLESRLAAVKYPMKSAGENIGEGYRTAASAVAGWMASSGHRANILSATYTEIGTAMAVGPNGSTYWVQVFGRPR
jgi:uncharacterized protein YkwD